MCPWIISCICLREWASDAKRRRKAKVPPTVQFATKSQIALEQIRAAKQRDLVQGIVLADAVSFPKTRSY